MPRGFFRDNLKYGGKKNCASPDELRDNLLREEMAKASARIKKKVGADDVVQHAEKKTAAAIVDKLSGPEQRAPVRAALDGQSLVGSVSVDCTDLAKAGPYYDDVQVCRLLGIRRRIIAQARTKESRGKNWDCVETHAGMSRDWVGMKLLELKKPITDLGKLTPIGEFNGVVSVKLIGTWPNSQKVTVERIVDGVKEIATVRDSREMHLGDIFDCRRFGNSLAWIAELNSCAY